MLRSIVVLFAVGLAAATNEPASKAHRNGDTNKYTLYNCNNKDGAELDWGTGTPSTDFIPGVQTSVIVHGHEKSHQAEFKHDLIEELFKSKKYGTGAQCNTDDPGNINIIVVDWSTYSSHSHSNVVIMVPSIGKYIADFLKSYAIDPDMTHLVGFDLGAHIVGHAGRNFNPKRITALDPSKSSQRLTADDAEYVEVIYTDTDGIFSNGLGVNIGHINFYPNGGGHQPGCLRKHECSHNRAWRYFAASINHDEFSANACTSMLVMNTNRCGSGAPRNMGNNDLTKKVGASNIYRVNTKSAWPFV